MALPGERTTQNLHAQHAGAFIRGRLTDGHQHLVGTGVGYGTRGGYGMNGAQGNGTGTGICITE